MAYFKDLGGCFKGKIEKKFSTPSWPKKVIFYEFFFSFIDNGNFEIFLADFKIFSSSWLKRCKIICRSFWYYFHGRGLTRPRKNGLKHIENSKKRIFLAVKFCSQPVPFFWRVIWIGLTIVHNKHIVGPTRQSQAYF